VSVTKRGPANSTGQDSNEWKVETKGVSEGGSEGGREGGKEGGREEGRTSFHDGIIHHGQVHNDAAVSDDSTTETHPQG